MQYEQMVMDYANKNESLIKYYLVNKDQYNIDEIKQLFLLKATGYKTEKQSKDYVLVKGKIPENVREAILNQNNPSHISFLNGILTNITKDYNKKHKMNEIEIEEVPQDEKDLLLEEIKGKLSPLDVFNQDFVQLICNRLDPQVEDKALGLLLIYLIEILGVNKREVFKLLDVSKQKKERYVKRTKKVILNILKEEFPEIDFREIERKVEAKKKIIVFITKYQKKVKEKLKPINRQLVKLEKQYELVKCRGKASEKVIVLKEQINELEAQKKRTLRALTRIINKLVDDLGLEQNRAKVLKGFIVNNFCDSVSIRAVENVHVWQKDYENVAQYIIWYEGAE
jgi:hypothetical protein